MLQNFRTYTLAVEFYRQCESAKVPEHLKDQLLRASSSVVLNIAEGYGRFSSRDSARFFRIALGSLREASAILDLGRVQLCGPGSIADHLGASLYVLSTRQTEKPVMGDGQ